MPPEHDPIIGLPDFRIISAEGTTFSSRLIQFVGTNRSPHCNGRQLRLKDTFTRRLKHHSLGLNLSLITRSAPTSFTAVLAVGTSRSACLGSYPAIGQRNLSEKRSL